MPCSATITSTATLADRRRRRIRPEDEAAARGGARARQSTSTWAVSQKATTSATQASRSSGWHASTTWWT